jgi:prepilin-type N-terminal cleavage/methylation domain-containing protein
MATEHILMTPFYQLDSGRSSRSSEKGHMLSSKMRGFTLIEMLTVLSISFIVTAFAVMNIQGALKDGRVTTAYNQTLMALRNTRQLSVDTRKTYIVTLIAPQTMQIWRQDQGAPALPPPVLVNTYTLPWDVQFRTEPGIPTTLTTTPDGFGTAISALDLDQGSGGGGTSIYFKPDGGGYDLAGNLNNGVIYMAHPGDLYSSRAITLYGLSGRLRGWRLYKNSVSGVSQWQAN